MTASPSHVSEISVCVSFALTVITMRLSTIDLDAMADGLEKKLGEAVILALQNARLTVKEACTLMQINESQFRHQVRGTNGYHLSLNRLARLPFSFWLTFSPSLIYLIAKKNTAEIAQTCGFQKSA